MNMLALESGSDIVVIDAGSLFPGDDRPGVDVAVPDFSYLDANREKIRGLVLTHGHLDHIGAVPYLLDKIDVPIYGTPFTLGLVRKQLTEFTVLRPPALNTIQAGESFELGCFRFEGIHVTHSTAQCLALAIGTPAGYVIHTGDFKIDQTPIDGRPFDLGRFAEYGRRGVLLLLADSTNADVPGFSRSEREVGPVLDDLFSRAERALFFSCFSSAVHRVQQIVQRAVTFRRKVALVGRSLTSSSDLAIDLGLLKIPPGTLVDPRSIETYPRHDRVTIIAGSQGEPMSSLTRAARDKHPTAVIEKGDIVGISAKMIPGNERPIYRMVDHLCRRGATVHYGDSLPNLHVSGHPCQEELKLLLNLVRPRYFVPIHGEYRQLSHHRTLAKQVRGKDLVDAPIIESGDVLHFDEHGARTLPERVPVGQVLIDHGTRSRVDHKSVIHDRRLLSGSGVLVPVVTIDERKRRVAAIEMISRGFVVSEDTQELLAGAEEAIRAGVDASGRNDLTDLEQIEERVQRDVRRFLARKTSRQSRPLVVPVILEG